MHISLYAFIQAEHSAQRGNLINMAARDAAGGLTWIKSWISDGIQKSVTGCVAGQTNLRCASYKLRYFDNPGAWRAYDKNWQRCRQLLLQNKIRLFDLKWRFQPAGLMARPLGMGFMDGDSGV